MTRTRLRTGAIALLITLVAAPLALAPAIAPATSAAAVAQRASLTDIESDVMCTSCREPLEVAQSPQADSERAYIRGLIAQGETKSQILNNLVAQYGTAVLGKPPAHGFNLTVYIIPPAILVARSRDPRVHASALAPTHARGRPRTGRARGDARPRRRRAPRRGAQPVPRLTPARSTAARPRPARSLHRVGRAHPEQPQRQRDRRLRRHRQRDPERLDRLRRRTDHPARR